MRYTDQSIMLPRWCIAFILDSQQLLSYAALRPSHLSLFHELIVKLQINAFKKKKKTCHNTNKKQNKTKQHVMFQPLRKTTEWSLIGKKTQKKAETMAFDEASHTCQGYVHTNAGFLGNEFLQTKYVSANLPSCQKISFIAYHNWIGHWVDSNAVH